MTTLPSPVQSRPVARQHARMVASELLGTAAILAVYFLLRGLRPPDIDASVARSLTVIHLEQQLGIFQEARWQEAFLPHHHLMAVANWVYAWGHYPVMLV